MAPKSFVLTTTERLRSRAPLPRAGSASNNLIHHHPNPFLAQIALWPAIVRKPAGISICRNYSTPRSVPVLSLRVEVQHPVPTTETRHPVPNVGAQKPEANVGAQEPEVKQRPILD